MYAKLYSGTVLGVDGLVIEVELDISNGLPVFDVVGLPDSAVREARDRVRAAIKNSGGNFPLQRITANLAPADLKKEGSGFDLALALGVMIAKSTIKAEISVPFGQPPPLRRTCPGWFPPSHSGGTSYGDGGETARP